MTVSRQLDRESAEALLDGRHPETTLGRLIANARRPAGPHELGGEELAVAAFRIRGADVRPRRQVVSRVLAVKVAAAGVLLAGSGLAVASATGTFRIPPPDVRAPAPAEPARPDSVPHDGPDDGPHDGPTGGPGGPRGNPQPGPEPRRPTQHPAAPPPGDKAKGPDEHARSPQPRGNTAHPTPHRTVPTHRPTRGTHR